MDEQPTMAELWMLLQKQRGMMEEQRALVEEQRSEIASLKEELAAQKRQKAPESNGHENTPVGIERRLTRAGLLKAAAAGVVGLAAAEVAGTERAAAVGPLEGTECYVHGGSGIAFYNDSGYAIGAQLSGTGTGAHAFGGFYGVRGQSSGQSLAGGESPSGVFGVWYGTGGVGCGVTGWAVDSRSKTGQLGDGTGVLGESGSGIGVRGKSDSGAGVWGSTRGTAAAVLGQGGYGEGVVGLGSVGVGVRGHSTQSTGVRGESDGGIGIEGVSNATARGVRGKPGVKGTSAWGSGVTGESINNFGVYGYSVSSPGVAGASYSSFGVNGYSSGSIGVLGQSGSGIGVQGTATTGRGGVFSGGAAQLQLTPSAQPNPPSRGQKGDLFLDASARLWLCTASATADVSPAIWKTLGTGTPAGSTLVGRSHDGTTPGVWGDDDAASSTSIGVKGTAVSGRGGVFGGGAAQLQLVPAAGNHPASGQAGDVFLDSAKQLWLCTTGGNTATWQQLGAGGGGGGTNPVVAHSHVAGTPGVLGDNDSNDAKSMGISGQSLDGNGQPGAGIGVQGGSGTGSGVKGWTITGSVTNAGVLGVSYLDATQAKRGLGDGVRGESGLGQGVSGYSEQGIGVRAETSGDNVMALLAQNHSLAVSAIGVQAVAALGTAVDARSDSGIGVHGFSTSGRGGVFETTGKAQLQLKPGGPRPTSGQAGDFYLDINMVLWFCTASGDPATWKQVQLV